MAAPQRFRSAFNGFNREDVVNYIEYLNNQHRAQVDQLSNQLQEARNAVSADTTAEVQAQLDAALQRCAELEEKLAHLEEGTADKELEAYRRAERAERQANERAQQIYAQANSALSNATAMAESAARQIGEVASRAAQQLQECQDSIAATADSFRDAAAVLYTVKADED